MAYIAIALLNHLVEGPLPRPGSALNKPSTAPLPDALSSRHSIPDLGSMSIGD